MTVVIAQRRRGTRRFAAVTNATYERVALPVGPLGRPVE